MFDSIVQISHLKAYNASFAEKFYGLRRVPFDDINCRSEANNLSNSSVVKSLILLTLAPYMKKKLDARFAVMNREITDNRANRGNNQCIEKLFVQYYPLFNLAIESTNLMLQVMFAVGNCQHHSLSYKLISTRLETYSKPKELTEDEDKFKPWVAAKWVARFLGTSLSVGAFLIQFLDYYNSRDSDSSTKSLIIKAPPPPSNSLYSRVSNYS